MSSGRFIVFGKKEKGWVKYNIADQRLFYSQITLLA